MLFTHHMWLISLFPVLFLPAEPHLVLDDDHVSRLAIHFVNK